MPAEEPPAETEASVPRSVENLLVDYDEGGRLREEALASLKDLGTEAIGVLQGQVLPENGIHRRLRAIAILAKLEGCSEDSAETKALVMKTVRSWSFEDLPLGELLSEVQKLSGVAFHLDESVNPDLSLRIKLADASLNILLALLLQPRGMKYIIRGKEVWIY